MAGRFSDGAARSDTRSTVALFYSRRRQLAINVLFFNILSSWHNICMLIGCLTGRDVARSIE